MKIMFASDLHGSLHYTQRLITLYLIEKPDYLVLLGDYLYHGPRNPLPLDYNSQAVAALLNQYKDKIIAIRGNCESEVDEMLLDFPLVNHSYILCDGQKMFLTHGHIYNEENLGHLSKGDILIRGHFHLPFYKMIQGILVLSPGSISLPKKESAHAYMIYENQQFMIKDIDQNDITNDVKNQSETIPY